MAQAVEVHRRQPRNCQGIRELMSDEQSRCAAGRWLW